MVKGSVTNVLGLHWNGSNCVAIPKEIVVCALLMFLSTLSLGNALCSSESIRQCTSSCFSFGSCEDGHCRCPDSSYYDYCTCLPHVSSCRIEKDSDTSIGTPTTDGNPESTYSCVASDNSNYEVHVIGNYESSNGQHGFNIQRQAGDTYVNLTVSGQSSRPLILVFVSYEPVIWRLSVPRGVEINRVIVGGYYNSNVTATTGSIELVEALGSSNRLNGYGTDTGGGSTAELLAYLVQRFGPVTSFSGSYRADKWTLNINRSAATSNMNFTTTGTDDSTESSHYMSSIVVQSTSVPEKKNDNISNEYTVQSTSVPEKKNDNISNQYTVQSTSVPEKKVNISNDCSSSAVIGLSAMSFLLIVTLAIIIVIQCLLMVRMKKTNDMMWRYKTNAKAITPTAMISDIPLTPNEAYALHKINKTSEEVLYDTMK